MADHWITEEEFVVVAAAAAVVAQIAGVLAPALSSEDDSLREELGQRGGLKNPVQRVEVGKTDVKRR